jgi:hypothetical protein
MLVYVIITTDYWKEGPSSINSSVATPHVSLFFFCSNSEQTSIYFKFERTAIETCKFLETFYGNWSHISFMCLQMIKKDSEMDVKMIEGQRRGWLSTLEIYTQSQNFVKWWAGTIVWPYNQQEDQLHINWKTIQQMLHEDF